ncbi:MAG: calcium-binding protein, partial [Symploca sp. SIO2B6]|nr:calcium-binding protein [Symploca sp. SIO2B6]
GDGNDRIEGNAVDNRLIGGRGNDRLSGRQGGDRLEGKQGRDRLIGGPGADRLLGQQGNDQLLGGGDRDLLLGGAGVDRLRGGDDSDVLRGGPGDDWLYGQGGDNNRLFGNSGSDTFVLERGNGTSLIQDFQLERDRIGLGRGVSFNQLNIQQDGRTTLIRLNNAPIAILRNIRADQLFQNDFIKL